MSYLLNTKIWDKPTTKMILVMVICYIDTLFGRVYGGLRFYVISLFDDDDYYYYLSDLR